VGRVRAGGPSRGPAPGSHPRSMASRRAVPLPSGRPGPRRNSRRRHLAGFALQAGCRSLWLSRLGCARLRLQQRPARRSEDTGRACGRCPLARRPRRPAVGCGLGDALAGRHRHLGPPPRLWGRVRRHPGRHHSLVAALRGPRLVLVRWPVAAGSDRQPQPAHAAGLEPLPDGALRARGPVLLHGGTHRSQWSPRWGTRARGRFRPARDRADQRRSGGQHGEVVPEGRDRPQPGRGRRPGHQAVG
jgi:hypothetical protein